MTLYEIDEALENCIDKETGEIDEARYNALNVVRNKKLEGIALYIKNLKSDVTELKAEEKALAVRRKSKETKLESLTNFLAMALSGEKLETSKVAVSWRSSKRVEIDEGALIPDAFWKVADPVVDKVALKEAMNKGESFPGVRFVTTQNMQIK